MGMNKLSDSKFFYLANQMYNFTDYMTKINFSDYYIPTELFMGRIDAFKGYKLPFVKEVYSYVKSGKIIPVLLSNSSNLKKNLPDLHGEIKIPHSIFNLQAFDDKNNLIELCDLSYKANYQRSEHDQIVYLDIPDLTMFYMLVSAYVNLRICEKIEIADNPEFFMLIADAYSLILSKIIDNMFPIAGSSNTDYNKLFFICACFCLQNMFLLPKDKAVAYALKMKLVIDKKGVQNESIYINSTDDFMTNVDYKKIFPIDNFCTEITKEYSYIDAKKFSAIHLAIKYNDRLTRNASFCLENLSSFITMLILGKGNLAIYNDMIIKKYLELQHNDIMKELSLIIK
jgi:hypothetical protein